MEIVKRLDLRYRKFCPEICFRETPVLRHKLDYAEVNCGGGIRQIMKLDIAAANKLIRTYGDGEWEAFVREWQVGLKAQNGYIEVKRMGGGGDLGRDVVGLCTPQKFEGVWDNYQCKHYDAPLGIGRAVEDAGKIIFHSFAGAYAPPRKCIFVAPRMVSTSLRELLLNPSKFRAEVLSTWNQRVAKKIEHGHDHQLAGALKVCAENYDYTTFGYATLDEVLDAHRLTGFWAERFYGFLPPPPGGVVPSSITVEETMYVSRLLEVYEEIEGSPIATPQKLITDHPTHAAHLHQQRVRFFDADCFAHHYRDSTAPGTVEDFEEQIHDAVEPALAFSNGTGHERLTKALDTAGSCNPAGLIATQAKMRVKQGVCHQLANRGRLKWRMS